MVGEAIRSIYFQMLLKDNNVQQRLQAITGAGDSVAKSMHSLNSSLAGVSQRFSELARENKLVFAGLLATASAAIGLSIMSASKYEASMVGIQKIATTTGRNYAEVLGIITEQEDALASKSTLAGGMLKLMTTELNTDQFSQFIQVVKNGSAAMGEDFNVQLELVTRGFKQLNPNVLDNIGLNIRMDAINKQAAKTYGVTQDKLTEAMVQQTLFNEMLRQGTKYAGAHENKLKTSAGAIAEFKTNVEDLSMAIGKTFLPAMNLILTPLNTFLDYLTRIPIVPTVLGLGLLTTAFIGLAGVVAGSVIPALGTGALVFAGLTTAEAAMVLPTIGLSGAFLELGVAVWTALAPLLPFIAVGAALVLIIQDLWVGLHGGKSVIMDFGNRLWGLTEPLRNVIDSLGMFKYVLFPILIPIKAVLWAFQHWQEIPGIVSDALGGLWDYLTSLPAMMFEAGAGLFNAFVEGLKSVPVIGPVVDVLGTVRSFLPFSDAKMGPLADLTLSGQRLIQTFGAGAESQQGYLSSLMGGLFKLPVVEPLALIAKTLIEPIINPLVNQPAISLPELSMSPARADIPATSTQTAPIQVSVSFGDVHLNGDKESIKTMASTTAEKIEEIMLKVMNNQARRVGI